MLLCQSSPSSVYIVSAVAQKTVAEIPQFWPYFRRSRATVPAFIYRLGQIQHETVLVSLRWLAKFQFNEFILSASNGENRNFGQILTFARRGSFTTLFTDDCQMWNARVYADMPNLISFFCFVALWWRKKRIFFCFIDFGIFVVSPIGGILRTHVDNYKHSYIQRYQNCFYCCTCWCCVFYFLTVMH